MDQTFPFCSGADYLSLPVAPNPWVVENLIPISGVANIYGKPKTGKSFAALGIAQAVASGAKEWLGFAIHQSGPVCYLQLDTPRGEWRDRMDKLKKNGLNIDKVYVADPLMAPYPFNILDPAHQKWLKEEIERISPTLVVVDTFREAHGADENDSTAMRNVVTSLVGACKPAALLLISHSRKAGAMAQATGIGDDIMDEQRGSSYIAGRMDTMIRLTKKTLNYKGRAVDEGHIPVLMDDDTHLLIRPDSLDGIIIKAKVIVAEMLPKGKSKREMAAELQKEVPMSLRTAQRRIDEVMAGI